MKRPVSRTVKLLMAWGLSLGLSAVLLGGSINLILPFEPYRLVDYQIVPQAVCPGREVSLVYSAGISRQPLATIPKGDPAQDGDEAIRTRAQWVNEDTGKKLEPENFPSDFLGYGPRVSPSPFVRYAPNQPGRWRQDITIFITGTQAFRPAQQIVPTFSTDPVTVKPFGDPTCR